MPAADIAQRLDRARHHLRDLSTRVAEFLEQQPYGIEFDYRFAAEETVILRVRVAQSPPTALWGAIIGEIIHNLRSSLDHLIFAHAVAHAGTPEEPIPLRSPWRQVQFPIFLQEKDWDNRAPAYLGLLPDDSHLRDQLWEMQPFNHEGESNRLWILHELWNHDKHRHPHLVGFLGGVLQCEKIYDPADRLTAMVAEATTIDIDESVFGQPFLDGAEIGRLTAHGGPPSTVYPEDYLRLHILYNVAFENNLTTYGIPVVTLLGELTAAVEDVVRQLPL